MMSLCVGNEHEEQVALFEWAAWNSSKYKELELMFAIPNGGQRHVVVARKLKDEGVKAGVPDIFLPAQATVWLPPCRDVRDFSLSSLNFDAPRMGDDEKIVAGSYHRFMGLFIELKVGKNKLTQNQETWCAKLSKAGYLCVVCYGAAEAIILIEWYLSGT
jgi:hypothetical protein